MKPTRIKEIQSINIEKLFNIFKDEYEIDLSIDIKTNKLTEYRSIFNTLCVELYGISHSDISRFYKSKGKSSHPSTVWCSCNNFKMYTKAKEDLLKMYIVISESERKNFKLNDKVKIIYESKLTEIQKAVTGLNKNEEKEILELINMRKASWLWKSKDRITVIEGS